MPHSSVPMVGRRWLLALSIALSASSVGGSITGCAAESAEDEEADLSEDELATRLSVSTIRSASTYKAMSLDGGGFGQAGRSPATMPATVGTCGWTRRSRGASTWSSSSSRTASSS